MYQRPIIEQQYSHEKNVTQSVENEKLERGKLYLYANIFVERNQINKKWYQVTDDDINYMIDKYIENNKNIMVETDLISENKKMRMMDTQWNRPYIWSFQILEKINNSRNVSNLKGVIRRYIEIDGHNVLDTKNENYQMTCIAEYETDAEVREIFTLNQIHKINYSWRIYVNEQMFLRIVLKPVLGYHLYQLI